uniref:Uncharacterized protein n=1 Tax=Oryza rufipogon TaxID=4529 RepID=A0A0E0QJY4_ORYRU
MVGDLSSRAWSVTPPPRAHRSSLLRSPPVHARPPVGRLPCAAPFSPAIGRAHAPLLSSPAAARAHVPLLSCCRLAPTRCSFLAGHPGRHRFGRRPREDGEDEGRAARAAARRRRRSGGQAKGRRGRREWRRRRRPERLGEGAARAETPSGGDGHDLTARSAASPPILRRSPPPNPTELS